MKKNYYSIFDKLANEFMAVFLAANDKVAIRMLKDSVKQNPAHCEDIELFYICSFSTDYVSVDFTKPVKIVSVELDENNNPVFIDVNEVVK